AGQFLRLTSYPQPILEWARGGTRADLEGEPEWDVFQAACELAERIDSFLGTVGQGGPGSQVAGECRSDLNLLLVLADWCADTGLPESAAEARHLYGLVCSLHREWGEGGPFLDRSADRAWPSYEGEEPDEPDEVDEWE